MISKLLLVAMLASITSFTACSDSDGMQSDDTSADDQISSGVETSIDNIPVGTNLNDATVKIYVRGDTIESEFDAEESGDIVDDAIYNRNRAIEERLNVNLEYISNTSEDFWGDRNIYMDTVRSSVLANDGSIDIAAGLSNIMPYLAQEGMFVNLLKSDIPYLNFDSDWWPAELVDELSVNGRMYMCSGEACLGVVKGVMCFYFNKNMIEQNHLDDPYQLVNNGKWTLDKMTEMASSMYSDLNGNTSVDLEDQFGFYFSNVNHAPNFVLSCGLRLTEKNSEGLFEYVLGSEQIVSLIDKFKTIMENDSCLEQLPEDSDETKIFSDGRSLFMTGEFKNSEIFRDMDFDFGILPYPKYDEEQSEYISSSRATYSLFGILKTANVENCAAVLEALASENYRSVTPAYYEKALKVKYSRDDISAQMFDLIRGHISFDFGVVHGPMMKAISTTLRNAISRPTGGWASTWASQEEAVNTMCEEYLADIMALED